MRLIFKIIFFYIFVYSFSLSAGEQKPSIAFFILEQNSNNQSIKLSLSSHLNKKGFISEDGNNLYKQILNEDVDSLQKLIENFDFLNQNLKSELFIIARLNYQIINNKKSKMYISSEIFNSQTKNLINSWSSPIKILDYPTDCDQICRKLLVSESSVLLSESLGESISNVLNYQSSDQKNYNKISKKYNFKLSNFMQKDVIYLTDIMVNEFPGFIKLNNEETFGKQAKWTYYSSSELNKLKKWLIISLADINLNLDQDYELTVSENNFLIKKFPIFGNKGSKGNIKKFN